MQMEVIDILIERRNRRGTLYYENIAGEIVSKECLKCHEVKELTEFYKHPKSLGMRKSNCISCTKEYVAETADKMADYRERHKDKQRGYFQEYYKSNAEKIKLRSKEYYDVFKDDPDFKQKRAEQKRGWASKNPQKITEQNHKRSASKRGLLNGWTTKDMDSTLAYFDYKCALTGEEGPLHFDHVIPLSSGHAGTIYWNMLPIKSDLNVSKHDKHIMEWFDANEKRFNLSRERLEHALQYLADLGGIDYDEYLLYIDWCHENKKNGGISMTQFQSGADALNALNATNEGSNANKIGFASFKSGTAYKVRILGVADLIRFYSYGVFGKVNSFVAKNPSVKNAKGFPTENLTPWDAASKYYQDLKFKAQDEGNAAAEKEYGELAYKYRVKERYALGFIDLATGDPIIIDLSKKQAQAIHAVIKKNEKKLSKVAFELSKTGSGQSTTVMLSLLFDLDDDLNDKERANFEKYDGKEFDMALFDGLLYEADDKEMTENLVAAGFDISLIGLNIGGGASDGLGDLKEDNYDF